MLEIDKALLPPNLVGIAEEIAWFAPVSLHERAAEQLRALEGPASDAVRAAASNEELYGELVAHHEAVLDILHSRPVSTRPMRRAGDRQAVVDRLTRLRSMLLAYLDLMAAVGAALQRRTGEWSDLGVFERANEPLADAVRETVSRDAVILDAYDRLEAAVTYIEAQGGFPPRELRPTRLKKRSDLR